MGHVCEDGHGLGVGVHEGGRRMLKRDGMVNQSAAE